MFDYNKIKDLLLKDEKEMSLREALVKRSPPLEQRIKQNPVNERMEALCDELKMQNNIQKILSEMAFLFSIEFILELFRNDLESYAASSFYDMGATAPESGVSSGLRLWSNEIIDLSLVSLPQYDFRAYKSKLKGDRLDSSIIVPAYDTYLHILSGKQVRLSVYDYKEIGFDTAISGDFCCQNVKKYEIGDGGGIFFHGGRQGWEIDSIDGPFLALMITIKMCRSPVVAKYSKSTGVLESVSGSDVQSSRVELMAILMRTMTDGVTTCEALSPYIQHRDHYVRWHVAREMLAADAKLALPHVLTLMNDTHPQVAEAAKATLSIIEKGNNKGPIVE